MQFELTKNTKYYILMQNMWGTKTQFLQGKIQFTILILEKKKGLKLISSTPNLINQKRNNRINSEKDAEKR